jgi:outer membrane assembly lipoprotein YfiO
MLYTGFTRRFFSIVAIACSLLIHSADARLFDLFKKDLERIPDSADLLRQENESRADLNKALNYESQGNIGKALSLHRTIVRYYPLATAASKSQFKIGLLYRAQEKPTKAFDAFQKFIETYTGDPAFSDAVRYQYEIAQGGQAGDYNKKIFSLIPRKTQVSDLLKWHGKIITNAPHSEYAPLSQFAIAEIYEKEDKTSLAIGAYQALVDKYPRHLKSAEAQFRIGAISKSEINRGSQDHANIQSARDAMEDVIVAYQDSDRAQQAREALAQFDLIEASRLYEIGRFYENQSQYRSAIIYYKKVIKFPGSKHLADARQRHADLLLKIAPSKTTIPQVNPGESNRPVPAKLKDFSRKLRIRTGPAATQTTSPEVAAPQVNPATANPHPCP